MRRLILSVVLVVATSLAAFVPGARAQVARDPAIESTIQSQFDAFLKDDVVDRVFLRLTQHQGPVRHAGEFRADGAERLSDGLAARRA